MENFATDGSSADHQSLGIELGMTTEDLSQHGRSLYNSQFGHSGTEIAYNQESLHHNSVQINRLYLTWAAQEPPSAFIPHLPWIANYGANTWDYNQVSPCDGTRTRLDICHTRALLTNLPSWSHSLNRYRGRVPTHSS